MKTTRVTKHIKLGLAAFVASAAFTCARADVQVAGSLYINVDATASAVGLANGIANSGSLGGVFDSTNVVPLATVSNVNAILLTNTWLWLTNTSAGALVGPAAGMVGSNPLGSIECWALNPSVAGEETMISWGTRNTGANVAFEYGSGGSGGISHYPNNVSYDAGWDFYGGYPAPGLWHHLVYTSDGVRNYLYADGVLINSYPPPALKITNSPSVLLGAQWTNGPSAFVSTGPAWATLALARIRVHSGTLTPAQILNNYNFEKASFPPPPVTTAYLTAGPVHRYSFNEPATDDASGQTFHDSVGSAHGTVQASTSLVTPRFTGRRLVLNGDISTSQPGYGNAYGALPAGLVSANSANNGGSGQLSIEFWYKNNDGISWSWSRLFDAGSVGPYTPFPATGNAITGAGGYTSGYNYLDTFYVTAQNGNSVGQRTVGWQNKDYLPGSDPTATNSAGASATFYAVGNYQTDRHVVVTWNESTRQINAYDNGYLAATSYATNTMNALNDVNVWLGRSMNNDNGFGGEYDEVRFYNYVLTAGQVLGDFQVGPNTINTGPQAASITTLPQSQSVNQSWPVTFYITASGSPGVSYQWNRNTIAIPGATTDTYTISAAASTNNGDSYSCTVSNNTGSPNIQTSTSANLTVVPNVASQPSILHETRSANPTAATSGQRDNYDGTVGTSFQVGPAGAVVSHLGYYDVYGDGLNQDHLVSIYPLTGTNPVAAAIVPAGTGAYLTNFYRYVALTNPVALAPNASYILQADVYTGDGDMWADLWQPGAWNPAFVGNYDRFTRAGRYGSHGAPASAANGNNNTYGAPNLAVFPMGAPIMLAQQTGVTQYVGLSATLSVVANGQAPMPGQWYKVGSPNTSLTNQNGLSLAFNSVQTSDEGNYYAVVSNALSTAQSANIYLHVLLATPVSITQQPTNVTVLQGYSASFYIAASGSPPIGYQWYRNNVLISGATGTSYTLVADTINNNDTYSCIVSNFTGAPHTLTSTNATLAVTPNQAPVPQTLYAATVPGTRDNYAGMVGAIFEVGATPAKVTHLGYYLANASLVLPHHVDIFSADGSTIVAEVFVSGTGDVFYNNYAYVALPAPVTLAANTSYILAAEVYSNSGDPWPDVFVPSPWNSYYVGGNDSSTRQARYGGNYPAAPTGASSANGIYGAGNMAVLPVGSTVVTMDVTNQTQYATSNVTFTAFVNGQPPVTVQWYKVGSPNTPVSGQIRSTLLLTNVQMSDAGSYYLAATGPQGAAQGPNAILTVLPAAPPNIILQPQSQSVYLHQQATFAVGASVPPQSYQWWFNGNPINGATASAYTVFNTDLTKTGGYAAVLTNAFGSQTSHVAVLSLLTVPAGSYASTVLNLNPLVYYPFQDLSNSIATGTSNVMNLGSLGTLATGLVEGSAASGPGPQPPLWPNFGTTNQALFLNPTTLDVDVKVPPLNLDPSTGPNVTLVAWINPNAPEASFAGIIFNRGSPEGACGLGIKKDPNNNTDSLEYHWANNYYTFNSGLYTTNYGNWAFVALAVDPNQAVFYLDDGTGMQTAVNVASHAGVSFGAPTYVGWDNNDSTRRFAGLIAEPMIFNRTLSPAEITQLYAAGIVGPVSLTISLSRTNVILTWPAGILQHASQVTGQYNDMLGVSSPATNPPAGYYRVRVSVQ